MDKMAPSSIVVFTWHFFYPLFFLSLQSRSSKLCAVCPTFGKCDHLLQISTRRFNSSLHQVNKRLDLLLSLSWRRPTMHTWGGDVRGRKESPARVCALASFTITQCEHKTTWGKKENWFGTGFMKLTPKILNDFNRIIRNKAKKERIFKCLECANVVWGMFRFWGLRHRHLCKPLFPCLAWPLSKAVLTGAAKTHQRVECFA